MIENSRDRQTVRMLTDHRCKNQFQMESLKQSHGDLLELIGCPNKWHVIYSFFAITTKQSNQIGYHIHSARHRVYPWWIQDEKTSTKSIIYIVVKLFVSHAFHAIFSKSMGLCPTYRIRNNVFFKCQTKH